MILQFNQVTKSFGSKRAVDSVSFGVQRGEFCVILGASGAGKSTLLRMVNGLVEPGSGEIQFDGTTINRKTLRRIRPRVAMVHQQFHLAPRLSVLHNVLSGALPQLSLWRTLMRVAPQSLQRRACRLLAEVGLAEEHLYRRAIQLSGGEQQRVAIARAFILQPDVVLADEPVASLDPKTSVNVLERLRTASRQYGATVLCSLHQVELARQFADRILAMKHGAVAFDGPADKLDDRMIDGIYTTQVTDHERQA